MVRLEDIPRKDIPWFPTIDPTKCEGCKECYEFCSHGVYKWDEKKKQSVVAKPYNCVVGCSTCASKCLNEAIKFPSLSMLKRLRETYGK